MVEKEHVFDVIVIGGGASGMFAAGVAAERGRKVLLLEKNPILGKKLNITGGGRCNLTNTSSTTTREFLTHFGSAAQYLFSPFSQHAVSDSLTFFESHGLPCKVEAGGRVFPESDTASDVTNTLVNYMKKGNVTVKMNTVVTDIKAEGGRVTCIETENSTFFAENIIIATGGLSHPETGSTGDGFAWLKKLGHTIQKPDATLVPLRVSDTWVHDLAGVTIPSMKISFLADGVQAFAKTGRLLFTHFGLSGPIIINSAQEVQALIKRNHTVTAHIDLFPHMNFADLDQHILALIDANKNKLFRNVLSELVPAGVDEAIANLAHLDPELRAHSLTQETRKQFIHLLKRLPVHIEGLMGLDRAIVSKGGVLLDEVDTRTMRSRKIENIFLTGDILDINRPSGGYSLQLCWTTGFVAGTHA